MNKWTYPDTTGRPLVPEEIHGLVKQLARSRPLENRIVQVTCRSSVVRRRARIR
jgi:hypothetical protein